ncbi:MAG: Holliday junction resolvase RuvX [Fimbriimonadaceae bacterium]
MRLLGVDLGKKRIGLAVMDMEVGLARPLPVMNALAALARDADQVVAVAKKEQATGVVLGLPLDGGEETRMSAVMRRFGGELETRGLTVFYVDESLTSQEANTAMFEAGLKASQRKKRLDSEAACLILERYKESHD